MNSIEINGVMTITPPGQPEGYDFYIPIDSEESRELEKEEYNVRMATVTVASIIKSYGHVCTNFDMYYNELADYMYKYDSHKNDISAKCVIPFIDSIHGENSNVGVQWSHSFRTPFIAVKYLHSEIDHSTEKDALYGTFSADEIGIDDATIAELSDLSIKYQVNEEIASYIMRNYPNPTEMEAPRFRAFISKKNDETYAYDCAKNVVTIKVNKFLADRGIDINMESLQWSIDFESKVVTISKIL